MGRGRGRGASEHPGPLESARRWMKGGREGTTNHKAAQTLAIGQEWRIPLALGHTFREMAGGCPGGCSGGCWSWGGCGQGRTRG